MFHEYITMTHLLDVFALTANITLIITVAILWRSSRTQNTTTSINLCRELLSKIANDKALQQANMAILNGKESDLDVYRKNKFLDEYDDLALMWKERIVKLHHLTEMHGEILSKIKSSNVIQNHIKEKRKESTFFFSNLVLLLKKVKKD